MNIRYIEIKDEQLLAVGGAVAFINNKINIGLREAAMKRANESELSKMKELYGEILQMEEDEAAILFHPKLRDMLEEPEFKAVMLHEEGHIVLGHLLSPETEEMVECEGIKVINNEDYELQADSYAVSVVGPTAMKRALIKISKKIAKENGFSVKRLYNSMKPRFMAFTDYKSSAK